MHGSMRISIDTTKGVCRVFGADKELSWMQVGLIND